MNKKGIIPLLLAPISTVIGLLALTVLLLFGIGGLSVIWNFLAMRTAGFIILGITALIVFVTKRFDTLTFALALIGAIMVVLPWLM